MQEHGHLGVSASWVVAERCGCQSFASGAPNIGPGHQVSSEPEAMSGLRTPFSDPPPLVIMNILYRAGPRHVPSKHRGRLWREECAQPGHPCKGDKRVSLHAAPRGPRRVQSLPRQAPRAWGAARRPSFRHSRLALDVSFRDAMLARSQPLLRPASERTLELKHVSPSASYLSSPSVAIRGTCPGDKARCHTCLVAACALGSVL